MGLANTFNVATYEGKHFLRSKVDMVNPKVVKEVEFLEFECADGLQKLQISGPNPQKSRGRGRGQRVRR